MFANGARGKREREKGREKETTTEMNVYPKTPTITDARTRTQFPTI
jgi:hypothetical protein